MMLCYQRRHSETASHPVMARDTTQIINTFLLKHNVTMANCCLIVIDYLM